MIADRTFRIIAYALAGFAMALVLSGALESAVR